MNVYAYVGNDPIDHEDPTGLACTGSLTSNCDTASPAYSLPCEALRKSAAPPVQLAMVAQQEEDENGRGFFEFDPTGEIRDARYNQARGSLEDIEPNNPHPQSVSPLGQPHSWRTVNALEDELNNARIRQEKGAAGREYINSHSVLPDAFRPICGQGLAQAMQAIREGRGPPSGISREALTAYRDAIAAHRWSNPRGGYASMAISTGATRYMAKPKINARSLSEELKKRNIRLNQPASEEDVGRLEHEIGQTISPVILSVIRQFDGFSEDFDDVTLISVWSIKKILATILDKSRLPYVSFADECFESLIFEVCLSDDNKPIYMESEIVFENYSDFWLRLLERTRT